MIQLLRRPTEKFSTRPKELHTGSMRGMQGIARLTNSNTSPIPSPSIGYWNKAQESIPCKSSCRAARLGASLTRLKVGKAAKYVEISE